MSSPPGRRLYIGRVPPNATRAEMEDHFSQKGAIKLVDCRVMGNYAFVEFAELRDAEDAVRDLNGREFMNERITVEFARAPRHPRGPPRGGTHRLIVTGFGPGTSWQDLKDFARGAGSVVYADVSRDRPDEGIVEYGSSRDVDEAFRRLDNTDLNGGRVRITEDRDSGRRDERDSYRRDDRYERRDYDDRRGGGGGDYYARERGSYERRPSPPRAARSPPPRRSRSPEPRRD